MLVIRMFAIVFIITLISSSNSSAYSGGTGQSNNPYQIANKADLLQLGASPADYGKSFILTADIDLDPCLPGGQVFTAAVIAPDLNNDNSTFEGSPFTGTFDGTGHKIANLTMDNWQTNKMVFLGLFGQLGSGGVVKNVYIDNCNLRGWAYIGALTGQNYGTILNCSSSGIMDVQAAAGGLVGTNGGSIVNCYSTIEVNGTATSGTLGGLIGGNGGNVSNSYAAGKVKGWRSIGGLAGQNGERGNITNCYATGDVNGVDQFSECIGGLVGELSAALSAPASINSSYATGSVNGQHEIGGLVGYSHNSRPALYGIMIANCYASGKVTGNYNVGGLLGFAENEIDVMYCYATGAVSGTAYAGGLVGKINDLPNIGGVWDIETSGQTTSAGYSFGLTTAQMKTRSTFAMWDANTWDMGDGQTYPYLKCFNPGLADLNYSGKLDYADLAIFAANWLSTQ